MGTRCRLEEVHRSHPAAATAAVATHPAASTTILLLHRIILPSWIPLPVSAFRDPPRFPLFHFFFEIMKRYYDNYFYFYYHYYYYCYFFLFTLLLLFLLPFFISSPLVSFLGYLLPPPCRISPP